ncbi:MAG: tetratricopeptide repeat protein [Planctomycetaceae bacterium]
MRRRSPQQAAVGTQPIMRPVIAGLFASLMLMTSGCQEQTDSVPEFVQLAQLREREQKFAEAVEAYSKAIKLAPGDPSLWYDRGVAHFSAGKPKLAIADYTKAIELDPEFEIAWNNLGAARSEVGDHKAAVDSCTRAIEIDPLDPLPWQNRGIAFHRLGLFDQSIEDLTRAMHLDPEDPFLLFARGTTLLDDQRPATAASDFTEAIRIDDSNADYWLARAVASSRLGQTEAAAADLKEAFACGLEEKNLTAEQLASHRRPPLPKNVREFLAAHGYVDTDGLWSDANGRVEIVAKPQVENAVRFSREQLESLEASGLRKTLIIFRPSEDGEEIIRHIKNWVPQASDLVPTDFKLQID